MAVQRRQSFLSQQRVDIPMIRSVESAVGNDFDQIFQAFVTNDPRSSNADSSGSGYVLRGFSILNTNVGAASGLQMVVDPGALMHITASQSGTTYMVPPVSYTHLRAHETGRNLVCRLLLEKKK